MNPDTRNFWLGAAWFVALASVAAIIISGLVAVDRYMQFDHVHNHSHEEHVHQHEHPHELPEHQHAQPEHEHPHAHVIQEAGGNSP